jgi:hypothetical protein
MSNQTGKNFPVSRFRGLVVDLMYFCQKVPGATIDRPMNLSRLIAARQSCVPRPSWTAILLKAMSIVGVRHPDLRRAYMTFPWPYLYEHPINVANFTIERKYQGEDVVFFVQVRSPENRSLADLDQIIRTCQNEPVESVKFFRRAIRMSKTPWPFRKLALWVGLNLFGKMRCHNFGTFSVTSVASEGAGIVVLTPLLTSTLHPGLLDERGNLPMRMTFDHRAIDGACAARALVELEKVLLGEIVAELTGAADIKLAA